ncbi:ABC transporter permease [Paenibacillus sp. HW567]|uniref:ABC transporter permease n=1 Tax=Paenibacillus sp. HW567 TaxID=1034769 RepID=UPI00035D0021|nr:ABC transporter permease [Paenibacillus sp. HW567]
MNRLITAIWAEGLKIRRSRLLWISLSVSILLPIMLGLVFSGSIGSQNNRGGLLDSMGFMEELGFVVSIGGMIGFGFVFSWIFGREYSDGTVKDLLALPLSRYGVAAAKLIVATVWCVALALILFGVGGMAGWLVGLKDWSLEIIVQSFERYVLLALMTICLSIPVAWIASVGRGYLSPLGFIVLTIVITQLGGGMGIAQYIPWAVPGLLSGASGEVDHLQPVSLILPYLTGGIGIAGTLAWWRYANHS